MDSEAGGTPSSMGSMRSIEAGAGVGEGSSRRKRGRSREGEEESLLDNMRHNKRYLCGIMSSCLVNLRVGDDSSVSSSSAAVRSSPFGSFQPPSTNLALGFTAANLAEAASAAGSPPIEETLSGSLRAVSNDVSTMESASSDESIESMTWRTTSAGSKVKESTPTSSLPSSDPSQKPPDFDKHQALPGFRDSSNEAPHEFGGASSSEVTKLDPCSDSSSPRVALPLHAKRQGSSCRATSPAPAFFLADAVDGKLPTSPSDPGHGTNLRKTAILRAQLKRTLSSTILPESNLGQTKSSDGGVVLQAVIEVSSTIQENQCDNDQGVSDKVQGKSGMDDEERQSMEAFVSNRMSRDESFSSDSDNDTDDCNTLSSPHAFPLVEFMDVQGFKL